MENRIIKYYSRNNNKVILRAVPGHFATSHSHINHYIDMTGLKSRYSEAKEVAKTLVDQIVNTTIVDTIVCMDGCEVVGALIAEELANRDFVSTNFHETVYVVTPDINTNNQLVFPQNLRTAIKGKHILLLMATATTGITIHRSLECINFYEGQVTAICSIFSAIDAIKGYPVVSAFTPRDIPSYMAYDYNACPFCQQGIKLEAFVNGSGYSLLG